MPKINDQLVRAMEAPSKGNRVVYDDKVTGFGVRITASGNRAFVLRYTFDDAAARRKSNEYRYTIGSYPAWSVLAARKDAEGWRQKIDRGETHPLAERQNRRADTKARKVAETYCEAVADYIKREQEGRRKNATAKEVERSLLRDCPDWLDLPVSEISAKEIRKQLEMIRDGDARQSKVIKPRPYLANRFYAYLNGFFRWCAEPGIDKVPASPMVGLRRPWEGEEARSRFFNDDEIKALWRASDQIGGVGGAYLKLALLTGKRRTALASMRWCEIGEDGVWTPSTDNRRRRRNKRVHATPLPKLALRILAPLRPNELADSASEFVFPGRVRGSHLDPGTPFQKKVRELSGLDDFILHACRHTVETRLAKLKVQPHVRDMVLDHAPLRGAGAGYDHHHYLPEMREALELWASHVEALVSPEGVRVLR